MNACILIQDHIYAYERCISGYKSLYMHMKHFAKLCMVRPLNHGSHAHYKAAHTTAPQALLFLKSTPKTKKSSPCAISKRLRFGNAVARHLLAGLMSTSGEEPDEPLVPTQF